MAALKVFITGATGYIGGDALFALHEAFPSWELHVLVRSEEKGKPITAAFPGAKLVIGSLDDASVLEEAAAQADIVVHTADSSDHVGAARAIAKGLQRGHRDGSRPAYWIHVSGTGILCWYDQDNKRYGQPPLPEQAYDDLEGVQRVLNLPDTAFHRDVDKIVLEAAAAQPDLVRVAIVGPPTIYGEGRGPVNTRSRQVPGLVETTLKSGIAPKIGTGRTEWDNVHVADLSHLFVLLARAASKGGVDPDGGEKVEVKDLWGPGAYFFAENGTHVWGEVADWVAAAAAEKGLLPEAKTECIPADKAIDIAGFQALSWGLNSRGGAKRARKFLGWKPTGHSLREEVPLLVDSEATRIRT